MKNYAKKYLSLFVAVLMAVTMLIPTAVFATTYSQDKNQLFKPEYVTVTATPTSATAGEKGTIVVTTTLSNSDYFQSEKNTNGWSNYDISAQGLTPTADKQTTYDVTTHTFTTTYDIPATAGVYDIKVTLTGNNVKDETKKIEEKETVSKTVQVTVSSTGAASGVRFAKDTATYTTTDGTATVQTVNATGAKPNAKDFAPNEYRVTSDNDSIAKVSGIDANGLVTITGGKKTGVATITLKQLVSNGVVSTCKVYNQGSDNAFLVKSISVDPTSYTLETAGAKNTAKLGVTVIASDDSTIPYSIAKDLVKVDSKDTTLFTTDEGNNEWTITATGTKAGSAKVIFLDKKADRLVASADVTVSAAKTAVDEIGIKNSDLSVLTKKDATTSNAATLNVTGKSGDFTADSAHVTIDEKTDSFKVYGYAKPFSATNKDVVLTSSNSNIVAVSADEDTDTTDDLHPATITIKGYGEATVTAATADGSLKAELKVTVKGLDLTSTEVNANVGDEFVIPYTSYGVNPEWKSNNHAVATVDETTGKVKVNGYGVAVITGTYDTNKTVTFTVYSKLNNGTAVYRVYNPNSGEHFYTTDKAEKDGLVKLGWNDEGIGWYGATEKDGVAVYRLYNANAGEHHYTTSASEKATLVAAGWKDEGISFYAAKSATSYPVYRNYNPNAFANNHNYSTNVAEYRTLLDAGWKDEGVAFYAVNPGTNG